MQWSIKEVIRDKTFCSYGSTSRVYELASLSKAFTALAIVILSLEKDFSLNEDISIFHKEFVFADKKHRRYPVTFNNLLQHTSGLDGHTIRFQKEGKENIIATALDIVKSPLVSSPGKEFRYATGGYVILGALIEIISGLSFSDYVYSKILKPLNMNSTNAMGDAIEGYKIGVLRNTSVKWKGCKAFSPAGYISSSIEDMEKLIKVFINDECSSPRLLQAIGICQDTNQYVDTNKPGLYYGFGWFWDSSSDFFFHDGCNPGFTTYMAYQRKSQSYSIWLLNCNDGSFSETAQNRFVDIITNNSPLNEWRPSKHFGEKALFWVEFFGALLILMNNIKLLALYLLVWVLSNKVLCVINGKMSLLQIWLWSNLIQIAIVSNSVFLVAVAILKVYYLL